MTIRLSSTDIDAIITSFKKFFQDTDHLWLFGSRANPSALGGDIDLYIETTLDVDAAVDNKILFVTELYYKIGDQKIDIVLNCIQLKYSLPIYSIAKQEGVLLI